MPKYPLGKVPLKVTSCWGSSLKSQLVVATDHQILIFFFFYGTEYTVILRKKKNSQDNLQMFLFQPTPFSICLVYTASFFSSFKYTSTYRTMTICEYTFDD